MASLTKASGWNLVGVWLTTGAIVLLLQSWLFEASFLAALASLPLLLIFGVAVLGALIATRAWKACLVFVLGTVLLGTLPLNAAGHQAWSRISFAQNRAAYETIVARAPDLPERGLIDGVAYRKDGPLVAFPRAQGMPDGWSAVIHDPADSMTHVGPSRAPVFGSNIQSCIRIEAHWHRCWLD